MSLLDVAYPVAAGPTKMKFERSIRLLQRRVIRVASSIAFRTIRFSFLRVGVYLPFHRKITFKSAFFTLTLLRKTTIDGKFERANGTQMASAFWSRRCNESHNVKERIWI